MTTLLAQNALSRDADDLLLYNVHLEANDTYWSDIIKTHYIHGTATLIESETISPDYSLVAPLGLTNTDYWVSQFRLATNMAIGPARYGALVDTGFGTELFLSDPSLPVNVWVGPIAYALIGSRTRTIEFPLIEASVPPRPSPYVLPFVAESDQILGVLKKGQRPAFLRQTLGRIRDAFVNISDAFSQVYVVFDKSEEPATDFPRNEHPSQGASTSSPLARSIHAVYKKTILEGQAIETAQRAVFDATTFVSREIPNERPSVMVSDEGAVMLQWRGSDRGVLLIFTGDGTFSLSIKRPGSRYTASHQELSISDHLPNDVKAAIEQVISV